MTKTIPVEEMLDNTFQTSDEKEFDSLDEAKDHESELKKIAKGKKIFESLDPIIQKRVRRLAVQGWMEEYYDEATFLYCQEENFVHPKRFFFHDDHKLIEKDTIAEVEEYCINASNEDPADLRAILDTNVYDLDAEDWMKPLEFEVKVHFEVNGK